MELKIPTAKQAYWGLRATVALADGALDESEQHLLSSIARAVSDEQTRARFLHAAKEFYIEAFCQD
jgi:tellurite resistance protein